MRVPYAWLMQYCDPGIGAEEAAARLTMAGTELERIDHVGVPDTSGFVIGKVLEAAPHPDADRLTVCTVDDGEGTRTIVCGAPNVAAGQTVAVAKPGAVMPDGTKLGEAKLRGVVSQGMILAEDEVGVGEAHEGTMVLDDSLAAGSPLVDHLQIADQALELEINPNRPDCMAVYGVARELHALTGAPLAEDPAAADAEPSGDDKVADHASVEIDPEVCLRFTARVFEDVTVAESPVWLKQRLIAAGQRPISNVVDITNYVMLLTGQPLHSFDLDKVRGGKIVVRRAADGEKMTTLDGVERTFDSEAALVCDAEGPSGIAGIMGGQISEVSDGTTRVLMEVATWVGPNIMATSKRLALRSEASARFERQLHPDSAMAAQRLAARLMVELTGARLVPGTIDEYPSPAEPREASLRLERLEKLLGESVPDADVTGILERLGFGIEASGGELTATVPSWRDGDVRREVDLIEEVARIHGLENLPATLPARRNAVGGLTREQRLRRRAEDALRDRGLAEAITYSFTSDEAVRRLRLAEAGPVAIANPLSEDQSVMRPSLMTGLLDVLAHNAAHGRPELALFESAHTYAPGRVAPPKDKGSPAGAQPVPETQALAAVMTRALPATWRSPARHPDFYAVRSLVDTVFAVYGLEPELDVPEDLPPFLDPGRSAQVLAGGAPAGWVGEIHPLVVRAWDLASAGEQPRVAGFELDLGALAALATEAEPFRDVVAFPPVMQDIAVVVEQGVAAAAVEGAVREGAGELLAGMEIFDLYTGDQVGEGNKSLALRLEFRAPDRTLTDEDVAERRSAIEVALAGIGGRLRA
jgi:phenylalanyl-tRNA synthetase beta chain